MARIPVEVTESIRERVFLPDEIAASGVQLRRSGRTWRGRCPFEPNSKSRTKFRVTNTHYRCYGCGAHGDFINWLQDRHGMSFREATEEAARRAGIVLPTEDRGRGRRQSPERDVRARIMARLHELAREVARREIAAQETDEIAGLAQLVESGELGRMPSTREMTALLEDTGLPATALARVGLDTGALNRMANQWVLWARGADGVVSGRPVGRAQPVFGLAGARSGGWIHPTGAIQEARMEGGAIVAVGDHLYTQLRASSMLRVFTPVTLESATRNPERLPGMNSRSTPPVLLHAPTPAARRSAYRMALAFQPHSPRLRVAELDKATIAQMGSPEGNARLTATIAAAGTTLDWRLAHLAGAGLFDSETGRVRAAFDLARIAKATTESLERMAYTKEIENQTGIGVPEREPVRPKTAVRARAR